MADQKIRLNPEFSLMFDSCGNHWLIKTRFTKTGKEYTEAYCGYHWSFALLLKSFVKVRLPEKEAKTVKNLLANIAEVEAEVQELAQEIGRALDKQKKELRAAQKGAAK